jgi:hypothetical protein
MLYDCFDLIDAYSINEDGLKHAEL